MRIPKSKAMIKHVLKYQNDLGTFHMCVLAQLSGICGKFV